MSHTTHLGGCGFESVKGLAKSGLNHLNLLLTLFHPILLNRTQTCNEIGDK
jgi:hypothetical protein